MYHNSERAHPAINCGTFDPRKENLYLDRIARLMGTDRMTLNSYGKIKLWEDGPNYQKVVKYVNNSQCHPQFKLTVVNIHRVWLRNRENDDLFHVSNRQLLWHGTKRANIPHILNNGFQLPANRRQMFGTGIYFADRISKSSNYSDLDVTFLLLCEVGLGNVYSCKQPHNDWTSAPSGFDSVKANGTYVPDWTDDGRYIGALIPFGKTAKCTKYDSHAVNYNEFIVYDPSRIIIRFLVEVKVGQVLIPSPLKLVTPRSTVTATKNTKKSDKSYATHKRNVNLANKTISLTSAAVRPSGNGITSGSNYARHSISATAVKSQSTSAVKSQTAFPSSRTALSIGSADNGITSRSNTARHSQTTFSSDNGIRNAYSSAYLEQRRIAQESYSRYPSLTSSVPVYMATEAKKQQTSCVIL